METEVESWLGSFVVMNCYKSKSTILVLNIRPKYEVGTKHSLFNNQVLNKWNRYRDTLGFCTVLRPLFGPFLMSKPRYMSIICIFCTFWYFDMFCEKCAYLSRKRESKRKVWKSGVQTVTDDRRNVYGDRRRPVASGL